MAYHVRAYDVGGAHKMVGTAFNCGCGKGLRSLEALRQHQSAIGCENAKKRKNRKSSKRLKAKHRNKPKPVMMNATTAIDIADSMDLPDGAYFAMIGDMMGGDYMDGVEAVLMNMEDEE